jgi:hypothetical protein
VNIDDTTRNLVEPLMNREIELESSHSGTDLAAPRDQALREAEPTATLRDELESVLIRRLDPPN